MDVPRLTLSQFVARYPAGVCECPDPEERIAFWDACLKETADVRDDLIPSAYISEMDQGLYGGLCGGKVRFNADPAIGWISSMLPPILSDWSEFDKLRWDPKGEWAQRYRRFLDVFARGAQGRFGISHFILIDSLNFVFELVGATETYLAFDEQPERVRRAIDFAFDLNVWVQDRFFEAVPLVEGGTCSNMLSWMPGRVLSESVDPFHMTSADCFLKWGVEPIERILARYDGGATHLHANGRHLLEAACRVKGLRAIWLGEDKGFAPSFDILPELRRRAGDMPLLLAVPFADFAAALKQHRLVGGCLYKVLGVPDNDAANRTMDEVRRYRV